MIFRKRGSRSTILAALLIVAFIGSAGTLLGEQATASIKNTDAVYTVRGNNYDRAFQVRVVIKDGRIDQIKVVDAGGEVPAILQTVVDKLIPRIIASQSLSVDSISGASESSNGVKMAVEKAIVASGGKPDQWRKPVPKSNRTIVVKGYDVIVVGLGGSGTMSYLAAAETGAAVFGIETAAKVGGTSTNVGGPMAVNPRSRVKTQRPEAGKFPVDTDDLYRLWMKETLGDAKGDLVRLLIDESGGTVDWLEQQWAFSFAEEVTTFSAQSPCKLYSRYKGDPEVMYQRAIDKAKNRNAKNDYALELTATALLTDTKGNVCGVRATRYDGTVYEVHGKAVILATGGYAGNPAMTRKYLGRTLSLYGMTQNNGAGIRMAQTAGGALYNVAVPEMTHAARIDLPFTEERLSAVDYKALSNFVNRGDALAVDASGRRFANEAQGMGVGEQSWKSGDFYYEIFSDETIRKVRAQGFDDVNMLLNIQDFSLSFSALAALASPASSDATSGASTKARAGSAPILKDVFMPHVPVANIYDILAIAEEDGVVVRADTIAGLAAKLGAKNLVEEVEAYNSYCAGTARDPFGKDSRFLAALGSKGPFYAFRGKGRPYSTCGGLNVNAAMNVLDKEGRPIRGLYAVGTDTMGVLFSERVPYMDYGGVAHGWALTGGRIAGAKAGAFALGTR
jgi:uncharacterized protein with FMN-binding domain